MKQRVFFSKLMPVVTRWGVAAGLPVAVKSILAALLLAQVAIETGWGDSSLAQPPVNNWSGIKFHDTQLGNAYNAQTREVINAESQTQTGHFQMYSSQDAWMADYMHFMLSHQCILDAMPNGIEAVAEALGPWTESDRALMESGRLPLHANYSTDPQYPTVVMEIVNEWQLTNASQLEGLANIHTA